MRKANWLAWVVGAAVLVTVVLVATGRSEEREFARLLREARPGWLVVALILQAATYFAQAEVFRGVTLAAGWRLPKVWLYQLSLAKLFVDQALPSAGIGSTVVTAQALEGRGVARPTAAACALINVTSYHAAYVVTLLAALLVTSSLRETNTVIVLASAVFIAFALALTVGVLTMVGRRVGKQSPFRRVPILGVVLTSLEEADAALVRNRPVFLAATLWQVGIFVLDAATVWVSIRSLGATAPADAVFAGFMIASLVRTMGVVPGGLGTFEATSVLMLRLVGLSLSVALSATLIFRGLSFWLPMLPGLWASRRISQPTR